MIVSHHITRRNSIVFRRYPKLNESRATSVFLHMWPPCSDGGLVRLSDHPQVSGREERSEFEPHQSKAVDEEYA